MQKRLVYSLLKPAIRAAALFRLPIKELTELVSLGYFEELSQQGKSTGEIALIFDQTQRNLHRLRTRYNDDFLDAERGVGLLREIESFVAAEPQPYERLRAAFAHVAEDRLQLALEDLVASGRVDRSEAGYRRLARYLNLVGDDFTHQIDGVNNLLDVTYRVVKRRLIDGLRDWTSLARAFRFVAHPAELERFTQMWLSETRNKMVALEDAQNDEGSTKRKFCLTMVVTEDE